MVAVALALHAADVCDSLPGCMVISIVSHKDGGSGRLKQYCLPKWVDDYTQLQINSLEIGLKSADPAYFGSCAGACWVAQVSVAWHGC